MKKFFCILFLLLAFNSVAFAGIEIPEYIKVKMSDNSIQEIELDTYLYGVVQSEIGVSYKTVDMDESEEVPMDALKAQAIASRSYAVYNIFHAKEDAEYHVTSSTSSQVYKNLDIEECVIEAVDETTGQIVTYEGEVACTYFSSTSGGHTEAPENVWTAEIPYLQGVEDPYEIEVANKTSWKAIYTEEDMEEKFPDIGEIEDIKILERSENDRVIKLKIIGSEASKILLKNGIRTAFGSTKLRSQWFDVEYDDGEAVFEGRGFGHGVGMSQNGAIGMALEGFSYDEIIKWYYTDVEIYSLDEYHYYGDDEENDDKNSIDDEEDEEPDEEPKPLLEKLTTICTTNWLLESIEAE